MADYFRCNGCGNSFKGVRGLRIHQSKKFVAMSCKPTPCICMKEEDGSIQVPSGSCPEHGYLVDTPDWLK